MKLFENSFLKKYDPANVFETVALIPDQAEHAWKESKKVKLPSGYKAAGHLAIAGMGGSLLGPHILKDMYADRLHVPLTLINGYTLPKSVSQKTLLVLSSYSGTTEEVLSCEKQSRAKTSLVTGISLGGPLLKSLKKRKKPFYTIVEKYNPSGQPRMGVAYSVFGQLGLLRSFFKVSDAEVNAAVKHARNVQRWTMESKAGIGWIRSITKSLAGRMPVIVGSEFLSGNAHAFTNQWNENAKTLANYFLIPEMNHHLLEGLTYPRELVKKTTFIFLDSPLLHPRNRKRIQLTKQIVEKQGAKAFVLAIGGKQKLAASLETLFLGSLLTTVFSLEHAIDPVNIPWVNYLKKHLAKN